MQDSKPYENHENQVDPSVYQKKNAKKKNIEIFGDLQKLRRSLAQHQQQFFPKVETGHLALEFVEAWLLVVVEIPQSQTWDPWDPWDETRVAPDVWVLVGKVKQ